MDAERITVTLSAGIVQVLQLDAGTRLDDGRHAYDYGAGAVVYEYVGGGKRIRVTGSRAALEGMATHCRGARHYCGAPWYATSATAALRAIRSVLDGE